MEFLVIIIGAIVLYTLITSIRAIYITYRNCMAKGSTKDFFSDIWNGSGGNILLLLGVLILCVPVYIILSIRIKRKRKKVYYRVQTRLVSDSRYQKAYEEFNRLYESTKDVDVASKHTLSNLVAKGADRSEAEETVAFFSLLKLVK